MERLIFIFKRKTFNGKKKKIINVYDGYIFQLYAQYFCLLEMGYEVYKIKLYSYDDNKSYKIALPSENYEMLNKFERTLEAINTFCPILL